MFTKKQLFLVVVLSTFYYTVQTQSYIPVSVQGFNHDIIAEGSGGSNRAEATTNTTFDDNNVSLASDNVLYAKNFRGNNNQSSPPPFGLPDDGVIASVNLSGAVYHLAPYNANNALVLRQQNSVGSLTLQTPGVFSRIAFLGASSNGSSTFNFTLNFSDGSSFPTIFTVPDWFGGANFAIKSIGRVYRRAIGGHLADEFNGDAENPRLYDNQINIPSPFNEKILISVTITKTSSGGSTGIFAINGITPINAPSAPVATAATNLNGNNFTANWLPAANATSYFIDVSDSPTFNTLYPDYNNRNVGNVLSISVSGLPNAPAYYYRIRASNVSGVSPSSNTIQVCTMPLPTAVCNNISIQLDETGNYSLTQANIAAIGNGSKDNCGPPADITLTVSQNSFSCNDLVLGQPNNYAVELDGINDFIQSDATNVLKVQPLTVEAWVKPALRSENTTFYPNNVLSNDNPGLFGHGFGANINSSVNQITVEYQNGFRTINNVGLSSDAWQHIAVVYTSGNVKTYVNGTQIDDFNYTQNALTGTSSFWIGKHNDDGTYGTRRFFKGQLDEVRVWHRALSAAEIEANMNTTSVGNESDLKLYYTFEDGPGSSRVKDILGNADANFQSDMNPLTSWINPGAPVIPAVQGTSVVLTVTNSKGNQSSCMTTVTVEDNTPPVAKCPASPLSVLLDNDGNASLAANALAQGNSTDNCPTGLVESSPAMNFTCVDVPNITVVLTATDASGNVGTCLASIQIVDNIPPVAKCPTTPPTVVISVNSPAMLAANALANGNSTDNCSGGLTETSPARSFTCTDAPSSMVILTATDAGGNMSTISCVVNIDDTAKPNAFINSGGRTTLEDANPTITLNASGSTGAGNTPLQFRWSDGTTGATLVVSSAGVFALTVTNTLNGCSSVASITIIDNRSNIPPAPIATSATNVSTQSFKANWLPATGAISYLIDVSESSDFQNILSSYNGLLLENVQSVDISGLSSNKNYYFRVRARNASGGTSANSNIISVTTLEQGPAPIAVTGFSQDIIAEGAGGSNRAMATTTTDIGSYVLYSKDFRGNNNLSSAPTYGLPANGFISSASRPGINFQLAPYTGNNALILKTTNQTGTLSLSSPGSYTSIAILAMSEGALSTIEVTMEFSDGNTGVVSFNVPDWFNGSDFAIKGIGRMFRANDAFDSGESPENPRLYNLIASLPPPFDSKILSKISFRKTSSTGSTVILGINGTASTCNLVLELTADSDFCEGTDISLTSNINDASQYTWSSPSGGSLAGNNTAVIQNAKPGDSGTYTLEVVTPDNCRYTESIDIEINPKPFLSIEEEGSPCGSDTIILNETGGDAVSWLWSGPDNFSSVAQSLVLISGKDMSGKYELTITGLKGCTNTFEYELDFIDGEALDGNFLVSAGACVGDSIHVIDYSLFDEASSTISFSWDFGNGKTSSERDPVVVYNSSGNYTITLNVESADCSLTIRKNIDVVDCRKIQGQSHRLTSVYPNPTQGTCNIKVSPDLKGNIGLILYNEKGQKILSKEFKQQEIRQESISNLAPGIYMVQILHELGIEMHRIIVIP